MKAPSRNLPPLAASLPNPHPWRAWALLAAAPSGLLWFASARTLAIVGIAAIALVLLGLHGSARQRARLAAIAAARDGEGLCEFARSFPLPERRAIDTWILRAVHDALRHELDPTHPGFPLRASDTFEALEFDPEDLALEIVPAIARRAGRSLDDTGTRNPHQAGALDSVGGLVRFLNAQPRSSGSGAS